MDLIDDLAGDQNPDGDFKKRQEKSDNGSALNRYNGSERSDGYIAYARNKNNNPGCQHISINHFSPQMSGNASNIHGLRIIAPV